MEKISGFIIGSKNSVISIDLVTVIFEMDIDGVWGTDGDRSGDRQKDRGGLILLGHVVSEDCLCRQKTVGTAALFSEYVASLLSLFRRMDRYK